MVLVTPGSIIPVHSARVQFSASRISSTGSGLSLAPQQCSDSAASSRLVIQPPSIFIQNRCGGYTPIPSLKTPREEPNRQTHEGV